ncbi:unnamed protein product [Ambrosiozyma monospora]|uniref:Unnamed protein product n=1 Tax=Ambrosiozyma monospora TaxID=43982 RepID=A0A9W6YYG0_AMBMO|nr:unnamed protein product [Ambrosiozyma monospora]
MKQTTSKSTKSSGKSPVASHTRKKLAKDKVAETAETVETGSSKDAGKKDDTSVGDGDSLRKVADVTANLEPVLKQVYNIANRCSMILDEPEIVKKLDEAYLDFSNDDSIRSTLQLIMIKLKINGATITEENLVKKITHRIPTDLRLFKQDKINREKNLTINFFCDSLQEYLIRDSTLLGA